MDVFVVFLLLSMLLQTKSVPYWDARDSGIPFTCSSEFVIHQKHCYRYFGKDLQKAFHHAQRFCSRHQSSLLSVLSSEEEEFVTGLVPLNGSSIWLGLNDEDGSQPHHKEGNFRWSSGEVFELGSSATYCNWKIGEPENRRHLDCVKMDAEGWSMAPGGCGATKLPFVCKKKACQHEGCTDEKTVPTASMALESSPTNLEYLLLVTLLLVVMLCLGLVGGACCYNYSTRRTTTGNDFSPT